MRLGRRLSSWKIMAMPRAALVVHRAVGDVDAVEKHAAAVGAMDAHQDLHQRRLAGAVLAEQRVDLARQQVEIDPAEHLRLAEALDDPAHRDERLAATSSPDTPRSRMLRPCRQRQPVARTARRRGRPPSKPRRHRERLIVPQKHSPLQALITDSGGSLLRHLLQRAEKVELRHAQRRDRDVGRHLLAERAAAAARLGLGLALQERALGADRVELAAGDRDGAVLAEVDGGDEHVAAERLGGIGRLDGRRVPHGEDAAEIGVGRQHRRGGGIGACPWSRGTGPAATSVMPENSAKAFRAPFSRAWMT